MQYFDRKWYEAYKCLSFPCSFKKDERACQCSNSYFAELFTKEVEKRYVVLNHAQEKLYGRTLDKEKFYANQKYALDRNIQQIKDLFPNDILHNIPDLRVFAMGFASKNTSRLVRRYMAQQKWLVRSRRNAYDKYYQTVSSQIVAQLDIHIHHFGTPFDLDMSVLDKVQQTVNCLTLNISNGHNNYLGIKKVVFRDYQIQKMDDIVGGECVEQELYLVDSGYEAHVLWHILGSPRELIVHAKQITIA